MLRLVGELDMQEEVQKNTGERAAMARTDNCEVNTT